MAYYVPPCKKVRGTRPPPNCAHARHYKHTLTNAAVEMNPLQCNMPHGPWKLFCGIWMCGTLSTG